MGINEIRSAGVRAKQLHSRQYLQWILHDLDKTATVIALHSIRIIVTVWGLLHHQCQRLRLPSFPPATAEDPISAHIMYTNSYAISIGRRANWFQDAALSVLCRYPDCGISRAAGVCATDPDSACRAPLEAQD